ncbi:MAG: glycosyltransferase [Candidatus Aenigmatarchaeota archaeon]
MKIIFRLDGGSTDERDPGKKRGFGHISRGLVLADKIIKKGNNEIIFIMRDYSIGIKKVTASGYRVEKIPVKMTLAEDAILTSNIIKKTGASVIVIDMLNTENEYMEELKKTGIFFVNIDDQGSGRFLSDLLVYMIVKKIDCGKINCYSGPSYTVIDGQYSVFHDKNKIINKKVKNILVSMGGTDPGKLTLKVLGVIEKIKNSFTTTVVIGPAFIHADKIKEIISNSKRKYILKESIEYMGDLMYTTDVAIISGGISVYEIATVGTPAIIICQNEHENTNAFGDYSFVIKLGLDNQTEEDILKNIKELINNHELRERMSKEGKETVDGKGAERIGEILLNQVNEWLSGHL